MVLPLANGIQFGLVLLHNLTLVMRLAFLDEPLTSFFQVLITCQPNLPETSSSGTDVVKVNCSGLCECILGVSLLMTFPLLQNFFCIFVVQDAVFCTVTSFIY